MSSIRFLADEDFDHRIVRGLVRRKPDVDIARAQDVSLGGLDDETVLTWAGEQARVVLTHDASTMTAAAYARIAAGLALPGVFIVSQSVPVREAIDDLHLIAECSLPGDWEGQVRYLPL